MKLKYKDTSGILRNHVHGHHKKDMIVCHETVSADVVGWQDIDSVELFLAAKDYGIHGMTDAEGHIAWAYGLGDAIFWQCGGVNERSVGIENVSNLMLRAPTNNLRRKLWVARQPQLRALAKLIAAIHNSRGIPLKLSDGLTPGVTSHYQVSQHFKASEGHIDCWPVHLGGYFPLFEVIYMARGYAKLGYTL